MHELSYTQGVLDIALENARKAEAKRITRINLVIGGMSGIVDDSVRFCFELLSRDSIASDAELSFKHVPTRLHCRKCDLTFKPDSEQWGCPRCRKWDVELKAGNEFYVDSIEVD
jgi:hydrogenase nickel incorporation protein HypA/HybF